MTKMKSNNKIGLGLVAEKDRIESGISLEYCVSKFLTFTCNSKVDHNSFERSEYPFDNHNIVDVVVENLALVECTNPKPSTWLDDNVINEKLDYFTRKDPKHTFLWILVVSFANFSEQIKRRIPRLGIILVELKTTATRYNFKTMLNVLYHSKLYHLIKRIHKPVFDNLSFINLDYYSYNYDTTNLDNYLSINDSINNLYQHSSVDRITACGNAKTEQETAVSRKPDVDKTLDNNH
jgi:hypothetical protein